MKSLLQTLFALALAAAALPAQAAAYAAPDAEFLSFAELYRMTGGDEPAASLPVPEGAPAAFQVQLAAAEPAARQERAPAFSFSGAAWPEPSSRGLLLFSGLALAAWVARRRLAASA